MSGGAALAISAASSLKPSDKDSLWDKIFSPKGGIALEEVMLSVEEDMNNRGAVKLHIAIVYEKELMEELKKMSAEEYFRQVTQLVKDHPDKVKIYEWELVAKKRISPWLKIDYPTDHMQPLAGYVFAKYSGSGEHREKIPSSAEKIKIICEKNNFHIEVR
jgi:hypothetical protein